MNQSAPKIKILPILIKSKKLNGFDWLEVLSSIKINNGQNIASCVDSAFHAQNKKTLKLQYKTTVLLEKMFQFGEKIKTQNKRLIFVL